LRGAQRGGFTGFLKGIGRGLIGVVTKPITGVLDLASHTTEGLKNTITYFDDKANEEKKRKPRAFYGRERYFKKYVKFEADLLNNLKVFEEGKYAFDNFIQCFVIGDIKGIENILIVTFEHLIYYNQNRNKIIFVVEPENINAIEKDVQGMKILVNQNSQINEISIHCKNAAMVEEIINTINEVRYLTLCINLQI
jgi:vacuolar protein sorting-associated protein 13A/C